LDRVVANELAQTAIGALTQGQRIVLRAMLDDPEAGTRFLADKLGVSKSQVNKEQHRISATFARLRLRSEAEREQVLQQADELLRDLSATSDQLTMGRGAP